MGIRKFLGYFALLLAAAAAGAVQAASGIEGGAERYRFEPGDQVFYETPLDRCPVGELLPDWQVVKGGYECARFRDRMWIRPLERGTVLYLKFPRPLPNEFSLELPVWVAKDGCPFVQVALHSMKQMERFPTAAYPYNENILLGGRLACDAEHTVFGAQDRPGEARFEFRIHAFAQEKIHQVAIQVRRRQVRFYVDGKRVAHRPFNPAEPIGGISLYFSNHFGTPKPYSDAPALVGRIRLAGYSAPEPTPQAEKDLIRELGAVKTKAGLKVTLAEAILFDFGQWALKPASRETLEKLAKLAKLRRGMVRVEGHTDDVGSEQFNRVLSELRAHVVALALARLGVDPKRIQPKGFGESRPVAPNDSEANRARNRRVEVILARP